MQHTYRVKSILCPTPLQRSYQIWDLESKIVVDELVPEFDALGKTAQQPYCTCLCWSYDGATLFSGYTDGAIRAWHIGGTQ